MLDSTKFINNFKEVHDTVGKRVLSVIASKVYGKNLSSKSGILGFLL